MRTPGYDVTLQVGRLELSGGLSLVVLVPRGPPEALEAVERALDLDLAVDVVAKVHDMGKASPHPCLCWSDVTSCT